MSKIKLPSGVSSFEKIRKNGFYYVDKTELIQNILESEAEVILITRPRRFGKTLNMDMLDHFFDIRKYSKKLFEGLSISNHSDLCDQWMNRYPTVFVSFKKVDGLDFNSAFNRLSTVITELFNQYLYLLDSEKLTDYQRSVFTHIANAQYTAEDMKNSLSLLLMMLNQYYGKKVILLIDEYDVPMAKASSNGYYNEMVDVMKGLMQALKDNSCLQFAVISGCLRIAKESIFTGTNNFVSDTITDSRLNEYFGFVQSEVDQLLIDSGMSEKRELIQKWYDGYHFGEFDVYCPWDVINYVRDLQYNPEKKPASYWINTSDNAIIRSFIDYAGDSISDKLETLMSGGYIIQHINENMTYDYLHSSEDNLWNILYLTGYLTNKRELTDSVPDDMIALEIPNAEIKEIYRTTVLTWFKETVVTWNRSRLFEAVWNGNTEVMSEEMNQLLRRTISYHDYKEDYYHAFLAGIFTGAGYMVESNKEHGEGRSDVVVKSKRTGMVAIFEVKYAKQGEQLDKKCDEALKQIDKKKYSQEYMYEYDKALCYGISFFKKRCLVKKK